MTDPFRIVLQLIDHIADTWLPLLDVDRLVDRRYLPEFEAAWLEAHTSVAHALTRCEPLRVREHAFIAAFNATGSEELAAPFSDDFGVISAALKTNVDDPAINGL